MYLRFDYYLTIVGYTNYAIKPSEKVPVVNRRKGVSYEKGFTVIIDNPSGYQQFQQNGNSNGCF
jgi:hypothetical protein